jgi:hypothetical protein
MNWDRVRVRLLGPVDVTIDGRVRPVSGLRRKPSCLCSGCTPAKR